MLCRVGVDKYINWILDQLLRGQQKTQDEQHTYYIILTSVTNVQVLQIVCLTLCRYGFPILLPKKLSGWSPVDINNCKWLNNFFLVAY